VDTVFDKAKSMEFPRRVLVGNDVLADVPELADDLDLQSVGAVVTGPTTRGVAGDRVGDLLDDQGFDVHVVEAAGASRKEVEETVQAVEDTGARFVFGVGGGRVIDQAKLCAKAVDGPLVSTPTSAAHDGITSPRASVRDTNEATSIEAVSPMAIVADTSVIIEAPYRLLAAGCADAISNVSAIRDWKLAHRLRGEPLSSFSAVLAETAAELVRDHAEQIRPGVQDSAWLAVKALIVSGVSMSVGGSSRPASGAEHMFSHALDRIAPDQALHGEQVGLGTILMLNLHNGPVDRVRDALDAIGAPTTAEQAGLEREQVLEALTSAHEIRDRYTILGSEGLTRPAAEQLVRATGVYR
jgi:glycerol-1-phosphate dehydrogenase [NAD(P)+]